MKKKIVSYFKEGFWRGFGWSFGATLGLVLISTLGIMILRGLGGLPLIGNFIADLVEATQQALSFRTTS